VVCDTAVAPVLEVDGFCVQRRGGPAWQLPDLRLLPGEVVALFGPSGSGKSTLLQALFGLFSPAAVDCRGRVAVLGRELAQLTPAGRRAMLQQGVVFLTQDAQQALDPLQPVGAQIAQASQCHLAAAFPVLAELGIAAPAALCERLPHAISGGEAQRVLLAIALLRRPALLVADEPGRSLDGLRLDRLRQHCQRLQAAGTGLLLASHDDSLLQQLGARLLVPVDGTFVPGTPGLPAWPVRARRADGAAGPVVLVCERLRCDHAGTPVLAGVDLTLRAGELVGLAGPSGAGKTTLLRLLAGHATAAAGTVQRPAGPRGLQYCHQDARASLTPGRRLGSLLDEARDPQFDLPRAMAALQFAPALLQRPIDQLSGGEQRRAALLRAFAVVPQVLLLDEPTAALDRRTAIGLLDALQGMQDAVGSAVLLASHDLEMLRSCADRVVELRAGKLWPIASTSPVA
jgi:peptide/nickel transport system ATP-binding protein